MLNSIFVLETPKSYICVMPSRFNSYAFDKITLSDHCQQVLRKLYKYSIKNGDKHYKLEYGGQQMLVIVTPDPYLKNIHIILPGHRIKMFFRKVNKYRIDLNHVSIKFEGNKDFERLTIGNYTLFHNYISVIYNFLAKNRALV